VNALFYFLCKIWYNKLEKNQADTNEKHTPINEMFTYGISNSCIHLHLPGDLHHLLEKNGISKTIDTVYSYSVCCVGKSVLTFDDPFIHQENVN